MNYTIDKFGTKIAIPGTTDDKVSSLPDADTSKQLERIADILSELENLRRIANTAEKQAQLAEEGAEAAKEESRKATRRSNISTGISVVSVIVALLGWIVPQGLAFEAIQKTLECIIQMVK